MFTLFFTFLLIYIGCFEEEKIAEIENSPINIFRNVKKKNYSKYYVLTATCQST